MIYILIFILLLLVVQSNRIIRYFRNEKRGWKFYKKNYQEIIYAEKINGAWERITIDAKIDYGTFVPSFKDENDWLSYPEWAQNRDLIISRITEKFPLKK